MTIPKHDVIRLRLTTLEKQDWAKAAGGKGKLSEWIRAICNAAAQPAVRPGMTDLMVSPEFIDQFLEENPPPAKPQVVEDAIQRSVQGEKDQAHRGSRSLSDAEVKGGDSSLGDRTATAGASAPASAQCARWFHHKDGVYCGACKKVIGR